MKYSLLDVKHKILQLEKPTNYQEHKSYLTRIIDKNIIEFMFPSWMTVTTIGDYAFYNCNKLTSVTIPDGVTTIGSHAFDNCTKLDNITIPDSVITIGGSAFGVNYKLASITIPGSVTTIGNYAFDNCDKLTDMYMYPTTPPTLGNTGTISTATTTIHVPIGSGDAYKNATNWSSFADKIVEDIEI